MAYVLREEGNVVYLDIIPDTKKPINYRQSLTWAVLTPVSVVLVLTLILFGVDFLLSN